MSNSRKVVVIGAGPAGYVCAIRLAQLGQQVTVVEREALGGTCLNVGCIPSKALIAAGSMVHKIGELSTMGLEVSGVKLDVEKLVTWKQGIVGKLTGGVGMLLKNHGCEVVYGSAELVDRRTVRVRGKDGQRDLACDDIVLATGSVPLPIPGFDFCEHVWSSTEALAPKSLPKHLVVIGGGYIGLELGMMYRKLGVEVTVVEATPHPLPGQDPDCVKIIERSMKKMKIAFIPDAFAKGYEVDGGEKVVTVETRAGERKQIRCDQILCTVGRKPYSEGLGLANVGLETDARGFVAVDRRMRTKVDNIYCIGDLAGQPMLAHKGSKEGLVAAAVIAGQNEEYDVRCVPAVIFTAPEMASVGLQEAEAREQGREVAVGQFPFAASGRAMSLMETEGFVKVVADAETDEVLGVHMVGPEVTELIAEATLAIEMGATTEDIARTIHAHPTLPEAMMEAAEAVHRMAVHIYQKK
jgi:dihydrolipoamide dehydrogenase